MLGVTAPCAASDLMELATTQRRGREVFADPVAAFSAGRFGMLLLLASLGMLFGASVLGYVVLRIEAAGQLAAAPSLPAGLWISTLLLLASSGTMHLALQAIRRNAQAAMQSMLALSLALGIAFLVSQAVCWAQLIAAHQAVWDEVAELPRYAIASFYVMTALHAAHVIGGLVPMMVITWRGLRGRYSAEHHAGVVYTAMYWHFLDAVWVVLFLTLLLGS